MNNLRAIFLVIGIILVGLDVVIILNGSFPGAFLIVTPIALVGASIYYTIAERSEPSKREKEQHINFLNGIRENWIPVTVNSDDCEVKSNTWYNEVGNASSKMASTGVFLSFQPIAIWDAAKHDDGRVAGFESTSQSVLVLKKTFDGKDRTFVSHLIPKDATTVSFLLHSTPTFNVYVNPANYNECLFDILLDY